MNFQDIFNKLFSDLCFNSDFFSKPQINFKIIKELFSKYTKIQIYDLKEKSNSKSNLINKITKTDVEIQLNIQEQEYIKNNNRSNEFQSNEKEIQKESNLVNINTNSIQTTNSNNVNLIESKNDEISINKQKNQKQYISESQNENEFENNQCNQSNLSENNYTKEIKSMNSSPKDDLDKSKIINDNKESIDFGFSDLLEINNNKISKYNSINDTSDFQIKFSNVYKWLSIKNNNIFSIKEFRQEQFKIVEKFFTKFKIHQIENIIICDEELCYIKVKNYQEIIEIKKYYQIPQFFGVFMFKSQLISQEEQQLLLDKQSYNMAKIKNTFHEIKFRKTNCEQQVYDLVNLKFEIEFNIKYCYISRLKCLFLQRLKLNQGIEKFILVDSSNAHGQAIFNQIEDKFQKVYNSFYILELYKGSRLKNQIKTRKKQDNFKKQFNEDFQEQKILLNKYINFLKKIE